MDKSSHLFRYVGGLGLPRLAQCIFNLQCWVMNYRETMVGLVDLCSCLDILVIFCHRGCYGIHQPVKWDKMFFLALHCHHFIHFFSIQGGPKCLEASFVPKSCCLSLIFRSKRVGNSLQEAHVLLVSDFVCRCCYFEVQSRPKQVCKAKFQYFSVLFSVNLHRKQHVLNIH